MDYKEKLEEAKRLYETANADQRYVLESLFPELAESEDERIKEEIIDYLKQKYSDPNAIKYDYNKWIVWLEKQGEQKPNYTTLVETGNGGINALVTRELPTSGCDNSNYCSDCTNNKGCINCENGDMKETEHKTEPKFKIGDWVVRGKTIAQILDIQEQYYVGLDIDGNDFTSSRFLSDDKIHLWTIQDAKDGDVLVNRLSKDNIIILYKGIGPKLSVLVHCGWNGYNLSIKTNGLGYGNLDNTNYSPATKEQRDLLFAKMREAGYEWDAEKKELKKISQRMISAEAKEAMYAKPAWSEEDEKMIRGLIVICDEWTTRHSFYPIENCEIEKLKNWLESLKERC